MKKPDGTYTARKTNGSVDHHLMIDAELIEWMDHNRKKIRMPPENKRKERHLKRAEFTRAAIEHFCLSLERGEVIDLPPSILKMNVETSE